MEQMIPGFVTEETIPGFVCKRDAPIYSSNFIHFESHNGLVFWCRAADVGVSPEEIAMVAHGGALSLEVIDRLGVIIQFALNGLMMAETRGRA